MWTRLSTAHHTVEIIIFHRNTITYLLWYRYPAGPHITILRLLMVRYQIGIDIRHVQNVVYKLNYYDHLAGRRRGLQGKGVVFTATLIAWFGLNHHPGHVVASLDNTLYDDYLCLVALNNGQIQWTRIRRNPQKHWITGNS